MGNIIVRPKCYYQGCKSRKIKKSNRLCNLHECNFHNCNLVIRQGSQFCDRHSCHYQKCNTRIKEGYLNIGECDEHNYLAYLYCIVHNCQNPNCSAFKKAETQYCSQCSLTIKSITHTHNHNITRNIVNYTTPNVVENISICIDEDNEDNEDNNQIQDNYNNQEYQYDNVEEVYLEDKNCNHCDDDIKITTQNRSLNDNLKTQPCQRAEDKTVITNYNINEVATKHPNTFNQQNVVIEVEGVGCRDCHHCKNCQKCVECCGCINSSECIKSKNCIDCKKCKDCVNCIQSENCYNSQNCVGCYNCVDCC